MVCCIKKRSCGNKKCTKKSYSCGNKKMYKEELQKLVREIAHLQYSDRLRTLGLPSLEYRRLRSDMVEIYKILNDIDHADKEQLFELYNTGRTRGHGYKLKKTKHCRLKILKHAFANRVISPWNSLSSEVVNRRAANSFKSNLNSH